MKKSRLTVKMKLSTAISGGRSMGKIWTVRKILKYARLPAKMKRRLKKLAKRASLLSLSLILLSLAGCGGRLGGYTEPEEIAVVSAIGFDPTEKGVRVSLQTVGSGGEISVREKEGESVSYALSALRGESTKRYELSHCALLVLGQQLSKSTIDEIYLFCENENEISDAALWIAANEANSFLSLKNAAGYDVASSMRPYPEGMGLFSENRFYEIRSEEISKGREGIMALPYFYVSDDRYTPCGLKVYRNRIERSLLDRSESVFFLMAKGIFMSGQLEYTYNGATKAVSVTDCRSEYDKNGKVKIQIKITEKLTDNERRALSEFCNIGINRLQEKLGHDFSGNENTLSDSEFYFEVIKEGKN